MFPCHVGFIAKTQEFAEGAGGVDVQNFMFSFIECLKLCVVAMDASARPRHTTDSQLKNR